MNSRRRSNPDGLPNRVYKKHGAYYYVTMLREWIRLSSVSDGLPAMHAKLADVLGRESIGMSGKGNMPPLIDEYVKLHKAKHKDPDWYRLGDYAKAGFADFHADQVMAGDVYDFLELNWNDKLPMQRVMRGFLSGFFVWAVRRRHAQENPCRDVKIEKPKTSKTYIKPEHLNEIMHWLQYERKPDGTQGRPIPSGRQMVAFVKLLYLTMQRSTEIRLLQEKQIDWEAKVIHFTPTKTEGSSNASVDWKITPIIEEILKDALRDDSTVRRLEPKGERYVIRQLHDGKPYLKSGIYSAWDRAVKRANLKEHGYNPKAIRGTAVTDAKANGWTIEQLRIGLAHMDEKTTQIYIKKSEIPVSEITMELPKAKPKAG